MTDVYRNLNRRNWSLRDPRTRRVVDHVESVELGDVTCIVDARQRQRALEEGRRNVHAFARGTLIAVSTPLDIRGWHRVQYNCFRAPYFTSADFPHAAIVGARRAYFDRAGRAWMYAVEDEPLERALRMPVLRAPLLPLTSIAELRRAALHGLL